MSPWLRRWLAALLALLVALAPLTPALARPLASSALIGRPCAGPAATDVPLGRSVDAFTEALYDIDAGSEGGALSTFIALHYEDDTTLWVSLGDIGDEELDAQGLLREAVDGARVCAGGRVFPQHLGPSTTPRLWAAKQEVLRIQEAYNAHFMGQPGGGRGRLDAYNPFGVGEIVSRKFSQLADTQEKTALGHVHELATKYRPGYVVSKVPSSGPLAGQRLRGVQILEVSVQQRPIPRAVLDLARNLKITIRDVNGKIYP